MRRRDFVTLLVGAAVWPLSAHAQQAMPIVGLLSSTSAAPHKPFVDAIFIGLRDKGFFVGQNIVVEARWADGRYEQLPRLANELARLPSKVIVAIAPPAAQAARAATPSIPIVFSAASDPVSLGLVPNLNQPGGNVSGVNLMLFAMSGKRLDLLTKFVPKAGIIGLLVNPNNPSTVRSSKDAQATAQALGKKVVVVEGGSEGDIDAAFNQLKQQKVEAISVEADPFLLARRNQIVAKAAQLSLPAIYPHREYVEAGGLVSYGTDMLDAYRQIGVYVGRILSGEQVGNLPVLQVTKFEMLINLKTAQSLNLTIPPDVITLADQVIE